MQAFIKENRIIINDMINEGEKEDLLNYINKLESHKVITTPLYNISGDKAGISFELVKKEEL